MSESLIVAGIDVGSECVKAVVLDRDKQILGRSTVQATGYFQMRIREAMDNALDDAQYVAADLAQVCVTGFGARCAEITGAVALRDASCHGRGAFHHFAEPLTVVDLGSRDPTVIQVDDHGERTDTRSLRKCAVGVGTFLTFAARHLDVHPTRLMELAAAAERSVPVSSYCSVFAESALLEQLRDGATREELALGAMESVAERVIEIGHLREPVVVTGGVPEYFPGVVAALERMSGLRVRVAPQPIQAAALGAALTALDLAEQAGS